MDNNQNWDWGREPDNNPATPVGAPTHLADAEEMPGWVANIVKTITALPILIGFLCGGLPLICGILFCIVSVLL